MKINSDKETIATTPERLYNVLVNFLNIDQIPEIPQVSNWTKLDDGCSFTIMNMITCAMRLTDQQPFSRVGCMKTGTSASISIWMEQPAPVSWMIPLACTSMPLSVLMV